MTYRMPCNEPDFAQSVPAGNWSRIPDPAFGGQYRYRNDDTGETVLVPAIWYNGTAAERASYLLFCAEQTEQSAARVAAESKPWSADQARRQLNQAASLRQQAEIYQAGGNAIAGHLTVA